MVEGHPQGVAPGHRVRAAGVLGLTGLDKPIVPPAEPYYDIRILADNVKMMTGKEELTPGALSALADGGSSPVPTEIVSLLGQIPAPNTAH